MGEHGAHANPARSYGRPVYAGIEDPLARRHAKPGAEWQPVEAAADQPAMDILAEQALWQETERVTQKQRHRPALRQFQCDLQRRVAATDNAHRPVGQLAGIAVLGRMDQLPLETLVTGKDRHTWLPKNSGG